MWQISEINCQKDILILFMCTGDNILFCVSHVSELGYKDLSSVVMTTLVNLLLIFSYHI